MKTEMRKNDYGKAKTAAAGHRKRNLATRCADLPVGKMSGTTRKLRVDARWRQFTEPEQDHIREIFERDGQEAAAAYCRKIGKPWSGSSISRFFRSERAGGPLQDVTNDTKLRSNSGWWQFTEPEREKIRGIFASRAHVELKFVREIGQGGRGQFAEYFAVRQFESFPGDIQRVAIGEAGMIVAR